MSSQSKPKREIRFLVGLPGVGKSTYCQEQQSTFPGIVLSLDKIIGELRTQKEKKVGQSVTFDEIVHEQLPHAMELFNQRLREAVERGDNILLDMIHDSPLHRSQRIEIAKNSRDYDYTTIAVVINPPEEDEHVQRLINRAISSGRFNSINNAALRPIVPIQKDEFDEIIYIGEATKKPLFHEYDDSHQFNILELVRPNSDIKR